MVKWDLSKLEEKFMPKDIGDFVWAISGLTEVIGESFTTSSDEGRIVSWSDGSDGYFLMLVLDDHGKVRALIHDHKDAKKTYAAIGYCRYHNITIELSWEEET
jgi:hypothetical protein